MSKKEKQKTDFLPSIDDISQVFKTLSLSHRLTEPYSQDRQFHLFRKFTLYPNNPPCYATSTTMPGQEPKEF